MLRLGINSVASVILVCERIGQIRVTKKKNPGYQKKPSYIHGK